MNATAGYMDILVWLIPLALIFNFFMARYIGSVAQRKGQNYWMFFGLTFVSWVVVLIIVSVLPEKPESNSKPKA
jgi:hypothetical protein